MFDPAIHGHRAIRARLAERLAKGRNFEILTVDQSADGPWLYLRLLKENPK